jgi:Ca2+-transporting ATPase
MVTGDNVKTAKAIAVECGILSSLADATERTVIEGKTFRALSDSEREEIADSISVESIYHGILILVLFVIYIINE